MPGVWRAAQQVGLLPSTASRTSGASGRMLAASRTRSACQPFNGVSQRPCEVRAQRTAGRADGDVSAARYRVTSRMARSSSLSTCHCFTSWSGRSCSHRPAQYIAPPHTPGTAALFCLHTLPVCSHTACLSCLAQEGTAPEIVHLLAGFARWQSRGRQPQ